MDIRQARQYFEDHCKQAIYEFEADEERALAELREALAVFDGLVQASKHGDTMLHDRP